ncbi:UNVERIFIED_CONTAM: DNA polymerase, partial [Kocuria sp. CPCC 205274]
MFGLGLGHPVYYGRTYDELRDFINIISLALELTDEKRLPVYVHHLAYDFQFIRKEFSFTEVFSVKAKTPIRAFSTTGIEFRDSLILSGLSLAKTAENLTLPEHQNIKKLVDGLEYGKVRHHETILTEKELEYCKNDILVILAFIKEQMLFNKDIRKIPMTNTGYVRRHVRNECLFNNNNHKKSSSGKKSRYLEMMKNMLMTETDYNNLGCAFMGGFTHASIFHIDCKLKNVSSIDLTSSYPTVMVAEKFPMGSARREKGIRTVKELKHLAKTKCFIAEVEFINIQNELVYESYFRSE